MIPIAAVAALTALYGDAVLRARFEGGPKTEAAKRGYARRGAYWALSAAVVASFLAARATFAAEQEPFSAIRGARHLFLAQLLVILAFIDQKERVIPNSVLKTAVFLRGAFFLFEIAAGAPEAAKELVDAAWGALLLGGLFLLVSLLVKGGLGMGDVKLFGVMTLYQGLWGAAASLFAGLSASCLYALALLLSKARSRTDSFPLLPVFAPGAILAILFTGT